MSAEPKIEAANGGTASLTPMEYAVGSYPNLCNPSTIIRYERAAPAEVPQEIYDVMGRKVAVLVDATRLAGPHSAAWHATDDAGATLASGMYLYRFTAKPTCGGKPYVTPGKLLYAK